MKKSINILIIGAGQIGSKHLQGALKSYNKLLITIVDPSLNSLKVSKKSAKKIVLGNIGSTVKYRQKLPKNKNFEICIISTNADVRAKVTRELLLHCRIKYIIFEKILFQKNTDYEIISKLLKEKNIKAWVNCPNRTYLFYKKIKNKLDIIDEVVEMDVNGSSWGMACNSIHYIDLFSYLVSSSNIKIVNKNLSNNILNNKRGRNFYEVNGSLEFKIANHSLKITCKDSTKTFINVRIKNKNIEFFIDELGKILKTNVNGLTNIKNITIPYISSTTAKLIDNLIDKNKCDLSLFSDSCKYHLVILSEFTKHFSQIFKKKLIQCPIT